MIRPMVVENHVVQRTVAARQMTTMTMTLAPSQMMSFFSLPTATATGNPAIGNGKGAIDEKTNGSGVTKGGAAAIAVVLILLFVGIGAFFFFYRRGYFIGLQRMVKNRRQLTKSQVSYPVESKIGLSRFPSPPGKTGSNDKYIETTEQRADSFNSVSSGPRWNSSNAQSGRAAGQAGLPSRPWPGAPWSNDRRISAPLPPTPSALPPELPPKDPFVDPVERSGARE